jgi:hypothetical protein
VASAYVKPMDGTWYAKGFSTEFYYRGGVITYAQLSIEITITFLQRETMVSNFRMFTLKS